MTFLLTIITEIISDTKQEGETGEEEKKGGNKKVKQDILGL